MSLILWMIKVYLWKNSVATAEGMIAEAIIRSSRNLRESRCMILGYGTCGRMLGSYLKGIGCEVGILEKSREACACAKADGMQIIDAGTLERELEQMDIIFNTVPQVILTAERLAYVQKWGVDFRYCLWRWRSRLYGSEKNRCAGSTTSRTSGKICTLFLC